MRRATGHEIVMALVRSDGVFDKDRWMNL